MPDQVCHYLEHLSGISSALKQREGERQAALEAALQAKEAERKGRGGGA